MINRRTFLLGSALLTMGCGGFEPILVAQTQDKKNTAKLIAAAKAQVGVTTLYDPSYVRLTYPGGDVARERGVCSDVIIRAYRDALGTDLQQLVHEDMRQSFDAYPKRWGLTKPDRSIDHRRVPNLQVFFARNGAERPVTDHPDDYRPGDLVTMKIAGRLPHIGIVSDDVSPADARPLIIHNIGAGTRTEDILFTFEIDGHYRWLL
jgi:uncharacterized protein